jgi:hypothetical protein
MASINISDLHPPGYELLQDSESFLNELKDQEMEIVGGYIKIRSLTRGLTKALTRGKDKTIKANYPTYANTIGQTYTNTIGNSKNNSNNVKIVG